MLTSMFYSKRKNLRILSKFPPWRIYVKDYTQNQLDKIKLAQIPNIPSKDQMPIPNKAFKKRTNPTNKNQPIKQSSPHC